MENKCSNGFFYKNDDKNRFLGSIGQIDVFVIGNLTCLDKILRGMFLKKIRPLSIFAVCGSKQPSFTQVVYIYALNFKPILSIIQQI
jgi:hypothetical protein